MATFTVKGIEHVSAALAALARSVPIHAAQALNEVAEVTMTDAKERTPVLSGTLMRSGKVMPHATPQTLAAELNFGTEYALYVHESMSTRHTNGEAKFLERAIQKTATTFERDIADAIRSLLKA